MFVGPTGCGKTHIWRCLQELFPDRIEIVDGSNITADGWKGDKKWSSLLCSPIFDVGKRAILVIDEADKMLAPKYSSGGENVSQIIAAEGLKLMEGTIVETKSDTFNYQVDTSLISFVLCGAFSNKADEIARNSSIGSSIGFGASSRVPKAYDRPLALQDLIEYGVMPEFMGRIHRIVNLQPMTMDDYYRIIDSGCGPVRHVQEHYGVEIRMTESRRKEMAEDAFRSGLGIRGMENRIRQLVDDAIFDDCYRQSFEI
ncbi:AAA family ATPase [bacterium D16-51]|nr:AAA family ATPase [bacterium D16-59]RKI53781.1 AAA family ATPase [bacterium D16-51]